MLPVNSPTFHPVLPFGRTKKKMNKFKCPFLTAVGAVGKNASVRPVRQVDLVKFECRTALVTAAGVNGVSGTDAVRYVDEVRVDALVHVQHLGHGSAVVNAMARPKKSNHANQGRDVWMCNNGRLGANGQLAVLVVDLESGNKRDSARIRPEFVRVPMCNTKSVKSLVDVVKVVRSHLGLVGIE